MLPKDDSNATMDPEIDESQGMNLQQQKRDWLFPGINCFPHTHGIGIFQVTMAKSFSPETSHRIGGALQEMQNGPTP